MAITEVSSPALNRPRGLFSQAVKVDAQGALLFVSGITSCDADGNVVGAGDVTRQTETIFQNMTTLLAEAGGTLADVVKLTVFVRDIELFPQINAVRDRFLAPPYPASSMVEVSRFVVPEHLIEIEAIAALGQGRARR